MIINDDAIAALLHTASKPGQADIILTLDRMERLLDRLGRPQDRLPPVFHVAGTNGKGSTIATLRSILEASGQQVHVFTSPHLIHWRERIRLAGRLISDKRLYALLKQVRAQPVEATPFETLTAAAFLAFAEDPADALLLETGLGGRGDSTNVVPTPLMSAISSLGLDHQAYLGQTLKQIAIEKAGIAKPGCPLVLQSCPPDIFVAICNIAADAKAPVIAQDRDWFVETGQNSLYYKDGQGQLELPRPALPGIHQVQNTGLAIAMLRHQTRFTDLDFKSGLEKIVWPARLQKLSKGALVDHIPATSTLWVDGGHNPAAGHILAQYFKEHFPGKKLSLVTGILDRKDYRGFLTPFRDMPVTVHVTPVTDHASWPPVEIASFAESIGLSAMTASTIEEALSQAPSHCNILITGSLYLAGEALRKNKSTIE